MKRPAILLAAAVLLAADAVILSTAAVNRSGDPEARLELTEFELQLPYRGREDTALALRLNWWNPAAVSAAHQPAWLDEDAKLRELGFDLNSDKPQSREIYAALALSADIPEGRSRLDLVDAARDARTLQSRYPDRSRAAVLRAVAQLQSRAMPDSRRGAFVRTVPAAVYVPPEFMPVFQDMEARRTPEGTSRYRVTLCYGDFALPWICGAQRTTPAPQE